MTPVRLFLTGLYLLTGSLPLFSQTTFDDSYLLDARIFIDTAEYSRASGTIRIKEQEKLAFRYQEENEVAEVYLFFDEAAPVRDVDLLPSGDFVVIDSLLMFSDYVRFKVRFNNLTQSNFLKFTFNLRMEEGEERVELPLFPYTTTYAELYPDTEELFVGEEKIIPVTTNNVENLAIDNRWTEGLPVNYRMTREGGELLVHVLPNALGQQSVTIPFHTKKPDLRNGQPEYRLDSVKLTFSIKSGRLAFLQFDKQEVTPGEDKTEAIEIQIDNSRFLRVGKTYRIEDQEEEGGPLIAELYTKARLNNDKVLCLLRPYAFHRNSEGYLYIKDGDEARFVTNLDITPRTAIKQVSVQHEGKEWEASNVVYPGETVNVRLEGEGLHKARFSFPGAQNLVFDSLVKNENISLFRLHIPLDINTSQIEIFNHNHSTGSSLQVKEYQKPRDFGFISLDLGTVSYPLNEIDKPIYYEETLTDLVFDFSRSVIDQGEDLHGKQYLTIKVKVSNKNGNLIELYQFDQLVLCPDESSARFLNYEQTDCRPEDVNLNNFLTKKTSELEEWSRIDIEVSHLKEKYAGAGQSKKIQVILKRDYNFDIDVSFPAGLLILKRESKEFTNFGGVSFAMLAQFSFYQQGKIARYKPYKVGAGFIAIDAFNFSSDNDRQDVGLVVIGSLYPTSSDRRLTFPLFMGGGYLLKEQKLFFLIGPGIRVRI